MAKKVNISGIIHSIIWLCDRCLGSVLVDCTIFCWTHILAPTRSASNVFGPAKFIQRKLLFRGSVEYTSGQE